MIQDNYNFYQSENEYSQDSSIQIQAPSLQNENSQSRQCYDSLRDFSSQNENQSTSLPHINQQEVDSSDNTNNTSSTKSNSLSAKERNKYSKGFYESIYRVIKGDKDEDKQQGDNNNAKPGKQYQKYIVDMIKNAINVKNSTSNLLVQQLADYLIQQKYVKFCDYLKYIVSHAAKRQGENFNTPYFYFVAHQIITKLIKQLPKLKHSYERKILLNC